MGSAEKLKSVALVTYCDQWPNLCEKASIRDDLLLAHLQTCDVEVSIVIWNDPCVEWGGFDLVVLRSTWDYQSNIEEFRSWLERMKIEGVKLWNPPDVILWNMDKSYLRELAENGAGIPDSVFLKRGDLFNVKMIMDDKGWERCLIKPCIGAGSIDVFLIQSSQEGIEKQEELKEIFYGRDFIVQEYIVTSMEWSLCFFGNRLSHAVLAKNNGEHLLHRNDPYDFTCLHPPDGVMEAAEKVMSSMPYKDELLYIRLDLVEKGNGEVVLMEVELIEPSLFFAAHPLASKRFSDQIIKRLN